MTRHSKGNNAGAVFTYDERKKMGHGTARVRIGSDSMRSFDCCCLTLQPCENPVVTGQGYLYDRAAILSNLLQQKEDLNRKRERFVSQEKQKELEKHDINEDREFKRQRLFEQREHAAIAGITPQPAEQEARVATTRVTVAGEDVTSGLTGNFWLPTNTPEVQSGNTAEPDRKTRCPMSGKPLRLKDLVSVKFTPSANSSTQLETSLSGSAGRYMCPVCQKVLTNATSCSVLRKSGSALCNGCVDRFVRKESIDPTTNKKADFVKDVIELKSGGTGYAASGGDSKQVSKYNPSIRV